MFKHLAKDYRIRGHTLCPTKTFILRPVTYLPDVFNHILTCVELRLNDHNLETFRQKYRYSQR